MRVQQSLWFVGLAMVAACGDNGPAKVTAPSLTSLTVSGSDLLLIGQSQTFTAADNNGVPITTARWGTETPDVVSVESYTGRVTAVAAGTARVFADLNGVRGTTSVHTLPNFNGTFSGRYYETGCEATGDWAHLGVCSTAWDDLATGHIEMDFTQDRDTVSGRLLLGDDLQGVDVSGTISPEGTLTFTGAKVSSVVHVDYANVRFDLGKDGKITGTFEEVYTDPKMIRTGAYRVFNKLADLYHNVDAPSHSRLTVPHRLH